MRMSCNGCRVLRKGCGEDCSIRPCLQWIKSPEAQANATVFLAKFYGRAGLMNLINAGPDHLRPSIFRSLLYEACGRIVNPIYGSAGLLWAGSWQMCQAAVESVLKGAPIVQIPYEAAASASSPPLKACDIRHVSKDQTGIHKVTKTRNRFKRTARKPTPRADSGEPESTGSENESLFSVDTVEAAGSHVSQAEPSPPRSEEGDDEEEEEEEVGLELTLGFEPVSASVSKTSRPTRPDNYGMDLGLELAA
ncbi:LOB domain-containing protein 41-like [Typha latifolia]|uniref:LOB domain-containing protein 41-like n=1 Tax=Typha latifolia TaxID=4733 RepID=UPI003C2D9386